MPRVVCEGACLFVLSLHEESNFKYDYASVKGMEIIHFDKKISRTSSHPLVL